MASRYWLSYLRGGSKRTRILPDFLIAAHASNQADQLITSDRGFYRSHFPKLKIIGSIQVLAPAGTYFAGLSAVNAEQQGFITG